MVTMIRSAAPSRVGMFLGLCGLLAAGCGAPARPGLVSTSAIAPGAECPSGGVALHTGIDANGNGILDTAEIAATTPLCSSPRGNDALVKTTDLPAGDARCPDGGGRIDAGTDGDGDGVLDPEEVTSTTYACNARAEPPRVATHGSGAWTELDEQVACPRGGTEVIGYLDADKNGAYTKGTDTVQSVDAICNGQNAAPVLVASTVLAAGDTRCPDGGARIAAGPDTDGDGQLDQGEIASTSYVCSVRAPAQRVAANRSGSWAVLVEATICPTGGVEVLTYVDLDGDGSYGAADSLVGSNAVCNGPRAVKSLSSSTTFTGNLGGCLNGGFKVSTGYDDNGNNVLDVAEITATYFVCHGVDGTGATLSLGINEGDMVTPRTISGTTDAPQLATVASSGASFYHFQTYNDTSGTDYTAPYTIWLRAVESELPVELYSDRFVTPLPPSCHLDNTRTNIICATQSLTPGADYYVRVRELYKVPNQFYVDVSFGVAQGTEAAPVSWGTLPGNDTGRLSIAGAVADVRIGEQSHYRFIAGQAGLHRLIMRRIVQATAPTANDLLDLWVTDLQGAFLGSCSFRLAGITLPRNCFINLPAAGTYDVTVYPGRSGATFQAELEEGDHVTPLLVLSSYATNLANPTVNSVALGASTSQAIYRIQSTGTELTITSDGSGWTLSESFPGGSGGTQVPPLAYCHLGPESTCSVAGLQAGRTYYVVIEGNPGTTVHVSAWDRGFNVPMAAPVQISGQTTLSSVAQGGQSHFKFNSGSNTSLMLSFIATPAASMLYGTLFTDASYAIPFGPPCFSPEPCSLTGLTPDTNYYLRLDNPQMNATRVNLSVSP